MAAAVVGWINGAAADQREVANLLRNQYKQQQGAIKSDTWIAIGLPKSA